jgi:putative heme iron utilization protein
MDVYIKVLQTVENRRAQNCKVVGLLERKYKGMEQYQDIKKGINFMIFIK